MEYEIACQTQKGDKPVNEDTIFAARMDDALVCMLADGLGGFGAGEMASKFVVEYLEGALKEETDYSADRIGQLIIAAHEALLEEKEKTAYGSKMCSTLVLLIIEGSRALYAHVGDSRLYVLRNGQVKRMTSDHSVCRYLVNSGELELEKIRFHEDKNKLTKAMGEKDGFGISLNEITFEPQTDQFFICSDGVWENLYTEQLEIEYCKSRSMKEWISQIETEILLHGKNDMDNYSMIAVAFHNGEVVGNE